MKTSLKVFTLIFVLILSTSCKNDDDDEQPQDTRFEKVNEGNVDMETLKDKVTNLEWINGTGGCFAGIVTPASQCDDSTFGGYSDWRTPTPNELSNLIVEINNRGMSLNYINSGCALMSTSMATWVFTENSNNPGQTTTSEPGNAGLRCVRNN